MESVKEKQSKAFEALKGELGYTNRMQAPRLLKVVISVGTGSFKDKKKNEIVVDRLMKITGQKPAVRAAKKSIATFKTRQGDPIGYQVTLRGTRMYGFLDKLLNVSLPRTKDFRGISPKIVDGMGNASIGIKEHTIFPETTMKTSRMSSELLLRLSPPQKIRKKQPHFSDSSDIRFRRKPQKPQNKNKKLPKGGFFKHKYYLFTF